MEIYWSNDNCHGMRGKYKMRENDLEQIKDITILSELLISAFYHLISLTTAT